MALSDWRFPLQSEGVTGLMNLPLFRLSVSVGIQKEER